ncbi:MAG: hypothetical protein V7K47_21855 [Nostoc sp.]
MNKLRRIGSEGAYSGTRHQFMIYGEYRLTLPSNDEYSVPQMRMMIAEVEVILEREITLEEWNSL